MKTRNQNRDFSKRIAPAKEEVGPFSALDGATVAVILKQSGEKFVYRGDARVERDDEFGRVLRVNSRDSQPGHPELIVAERGWSGRIIPDLEHGCDYCVIPDG